MSSRFVLSVSLTLFSVLLVFSLSMAASSATSVAYTKAKVSGVSLNIVTIDLNDSNVRVTPAIAKYGIGTAESFRSMMRRTRPAAAINGTFFCTKSLKPTGDIVVDGQLLWKGYLGNAVAIDGNNNVKFLPSRHSDLYKWSDFDRVMAAGPTLILRGKTIVMPRAEGFKSNVHFSKRGRSAVGLTYSNKLVFVTTRQRIYLRQLAYAMKRLKCVDAAALDGGSSSGLYWKGKLIMNPGRGMTSCLLVYDNPSSFEQSRNCLYPISGYSSLPPSGT